MLKLFIKFNKRKKRNKNSKSTKNNLLKHIIDSNIINSINATSRQSSTTPQPPTLVKFDDNTIDLDIVRKALTGSYRDANKLLKYIPESKGLIEDYYKEYGSKLLVDLDAEYVKKIEYYDKKREYDESKRKSALAEMEHKEEYLRNRIDDVERDLREKSNQLYEINDNYNELKLNFKSNRSNLLKSKVLNYAMKEKTDKLASTIDDQVTNINQYIKKLMN